MENYINESYGLTLIPALAIGALVTVVVLALSANPQ